MTNKSLLGVLKKKLTYRKGELVLELSGVLPEYRPTLKTLTWEIPFALTYGCKMVAPVEIGMPRYHVQHFI